MPVDTQQSSHSSHSSHPAGAARILSNALENMTTPGIGPDQARARVNSCEYVSFDYAGTMAADPVVAVRMNFSPLDGENDNKDFDIEWTTGGKMSELAIMNDGGSLAATGAKNSLSNNSNWALFLRSLTDISFDTKLLDGPTGVRYMAGAELTIRRMKQPTRDGLADQNQSGRSKEYYTCLKIDVMPGEKKPTSRRTAPKAQAPAQAAPAPQAASVTQAAPAHSASSNGSSPLDYIKSILSDSNGSISIRDLKISVFQSLKAQGKSSKECQEQGSQITENWLEEQSMLNDLNWSVDGGILSAS